MIAERKNLALPLQLTSIILEQQKLLDSFYRKIDFGEGNADQLHSFKAWDQERAAILVLTAAIGLQKRALAVVTEISMQKFSRSVAPARAENARAFLALVAEIQTLMRADQALADGLEPAEIALLRPKPFPARVLGPDVYEWILDAISERILDPAELGNLRMETVSTTRAGLSQE